MALNTNPQSWEFIENRFVLDWDGKHSKFVELIKHIRKSRLSDRLYGSTSMDKLVLSNNTPLDYGQEALHITFDTATREWSFIYYSKPNIKPEFKRTYTEDQAIEKLDNFVKMINW
jgi:hypothetical protein